MYLRNRSVTGWVLVLVFVVMGWQIATKGWWLLLVGPGLLLAFPLLVLVQLLASRSVRLHPGGRLLPRLAELQVLAFVLSLVTLVGMGDDPKVTLFGFLVADEGDPLTALSWTLCTAGVWVLALDTVLLVAVLIVRALSPQPQDVVAGTGRDTPQG